MNDVIKLAPCVVNPILRHVAEKRESLSGQWKFRLDPDDVGIQECWYENPASFYESISVPGSWQGQGFGKIEDDFVWDFSHVVRTFKATYKGTGWYCRTFLLNPGWQGSQVWLSFGGAHPTAEVWLNGVKLGVHHEPFVPFGFNITKMVQLGQENIIAVRISETDRQYGMSFSWQGSWSGLYRDVELTATGETYLKSCKLYADVDKKTVTIRVQTGGSGRMAWVRAAIGRLGICPRPDTERYEAETEVVFEVVNGVAEQTIPVNSPLLWSPDAPNLYRADIVLLDGEQILDASSERFGFTKLACVGKQIQVNDQPYFIRGSGDFISCPETGCPDWNRDRWRERLRTLRSYGYNQIRLQSYVYGPEYYDIADEVGLIIQSEMGMLGGWGSSTIWHTYQWPVPTAANYDRLKTQWDHVVLRDVNHPSATIYCMSNEYATGAARRFLKTAWRCYHETKAVKPNCLIIWTDGGIDDQMPGDFINAEASKDSECTLPLIQHEYRWWSSLPDVSLIPRYNKGAVRHYAADIAIKAASRHGIAHTLAQGAKNSNIVQFIEAKGKMERVRRDYPTLAGISHFDAMDAVASPQGIINEFYENKYATAGQWMQTNGDTVLLCSIEFTEHVYASGQDFSQTLFVSDFSHPALVNPQVSWRVVQDSGKELLKGNLSYSHEPYRTNKIGTITFRAPMVDKPVKAYLQAFIQDDGRIFDNSWPLWFYPAQVAMPDRVEIYSAADKALWLSKSSMPIVADIENPSCKAVWTDKINHQLISFMERGGRVILTAGEGTTRGFGPALGLADGRYYFTPPANYPPYEDGHDGTIIKTSPIWGDIPHEGFADLNFFRIMAECPPIELEPLGFNAIDPFLRAMHKYPSGHSVGYLTEARIGQGGLIISSFDLDPKWPEALYLTSCIGSYAAGDEFQPANELAADSIDRLLTLTGI